MPQRILFLVANLAEEENLRRAMTACPAGWETFVVRTSDEAMRAVTEQPVDVIVADFDKDDSSSATLLNWAGENHPKALRLILALPEEREKALRTVLGQHHFLAKPVAPEVLAETIQRAISLDAALPNERLRNLAARIRVFPPLPSLYFQAMRELKSPDFSAQTVGEIVAKDLAMTTRLLQVLNSGFYSLPCQITDPTEAVGLLGQEMVKSLIISIHVFLKYDQIKPLYFSISQLWRHSTAVANAARQITQMETGNTEWADDAYTAGLLHDIGKLVLANNFETEYNEVQKQARASKRPLWQVETETFGVSHAEVGAFLLGRWGMPVGLLEATALHHQPSRSQGRTFSVLTAVHIANVLKQERLSGSEEQPVSMFDCAYLEELGLSGQVDAWKECLERGVPLAKTKLSNPNPSQPEKPLPVPQFLKPEVDADRSRKSDRYMAVTAVVVAAIAVAALLGWYLRRPISGHARTTTSKTGQKAHGRVDRKVAIDQTNTPPAANTNTNVAGASPGAAPAGEKAPPPPAANAPDAPVAIDPKPDEPAKPAEPAEKPQL